MVFALVGHLFSLGTVLGPLLFLIYINDLHDCVMSRVRLFADDCLIYCKIHNLEDQLAVQKDLDILEQWSNKWGMQFNPGKCNILSISRSIPLHRFYSLCGTVLQNVDEARYLGINLSKDLQWGIISKALQPSLVPLLVF